jgi:hypothetical protein
MEEYTKNYVVGHHDKITRLKDIATNVINNTQFPIIFKDICKLKSTIWLVK